MCHHRRPTGSNLQQVSFLEEQLDLLTQARRQDRPDTNPLPPAEWERLRQENEHLVKRLAFMQGRRSGPANLPSASNHFCSL
ncbi:hypothetical protein [Synechocystis sp. PCC 7338]|uniref:hypothetical protein n=1 Tax=Synechocystis sp. PCC 7338 TaxID=2732530 RepID=UPI001BB01499|nr:hypothetical protein [Synechocystis sp. PCC 7338]QUS62534.1 hypothetical protein HTZ78_17570 [Synechocystis sp. PCC 7338]